MRKREDTAEGCRELALHDQERANGAASVHMRHTFERSAGAWTARALLLERLDARLTERVQTAAGEQDRQRVDREGHG